MEQIEKTQPRVSKKLVNKSQQVQIKRHFERSIQAKKLARYLPKPIQIAQRTQEESEVYWLWCQVYKTIYPSYKVIRDDPHNQQAHILYTYDQQGKVVSSARLTIDSSLGLPSEEYFSSEIGEYRNNANKLMEFGRFVIKNGNLKLLKAYYKAVYEIAKAEDVDVIIMTMKQKNFDLHHDLMGAKLLLFDMKIPIGGKHKMSCVAWDVNATKQRFLNWVGIRSLQHGKV